VAGGLDGLWVLIRLLLRFYQFSRYPMRTFTAIVERCSDTGLYVGYVPGFLGAHSQGQTLDELNENIQEVVSLLLDRGIA